MTDRVAVWFEAGALTGYEARKKLEGAYGGDSSAFEQHPKLDSFVDTLRTLYPATSLHRGDGFVHIAIRYSDPDSLISAIADVAGRHDLVCFSSRTETVFLPAWLVPPLTLNTSWRGDVCEPSEATVTGSVREALLGGGYASITRELERYVQAGAGPAIGHKAAAYAIEYRDGSVYAHYRYETDDIDEIVDVFADFARGDHGYQERYAWRQNVLELP